MSLLDLTYNGKFLAQCWPGLYPVFYVSKRSEVVCPNCANYDMTEEAFKYRCGHGLTLVDCDANYDNPHLYCDICRDRIISAYTEDEQ